MQCATTQAEMWPWRLLQPTSVGWGALFGGGVGYKDDDEDKDEDNDNKEEEGE